MASDRSAIEVLRGTDITPIAQLSPDVQDASSRVIDGVVTITWPYSVVTKTIAFILAEHDFRLRRQKGQLRVEFQGPAAKAFAESNVGGGDEVRISLDGAKWDEPHAPTRLPAGALGWQLTFSNRLLLDIRRASEEASDFIDIQEPEVPEPESQPEPNDAADDEPMPASPEPQSPRADVAAMPNTLTATPASVFTAKRPVSSMLGPDEYASPAFLKRARVSYGSLFEGGLDIFAEDKETKPKEKRRPRYSMQNTSWKIASRSPSPEAEQASERDTDAGIKIQEQPRVEHIPSSVSRTPMVDEACQTQEDTLSPSRSNVQVAAEVRVSDSLSQFQPTSAIPALINNVQRNALQTPSRTLFERRAIPNDASTPLEKLQNGYPEPELQENHQGFGAESSRNVPDMLQASPPPVQPPSTFGESTPAPGYPLATFTSSDLGTTTLHVDPSLRHQDVMPTPAHMFFDAPAPGEAEWDPESLPGQDTLSPSRIDTHRPEVITLESSPMRPQPPFLDMSSRDIDTTEQGYDPESVKAVEPLMEDTVAQADQVSREDDEDEAEASEDSEEVSGEDYDLRNYDRAKDDDEESEEDSLEESSDVQKQVIDPSEDDDDEGDSQEEISDSGYVQPPMPGEQGTSHTANMMQAADIEDHPSSDAEDASDDEAGVSLGSEDRFDDPEEYDERFDDENGYEYDEDDDDEGEDYEEDDEYENMRNMPSFRPAPIVSAPQEPVFIDLLSDSDDEDAAQPTQPPTTSPPAANTEEAETAASPKHEASAKKVEAAEATEIQSQVEQTSPLESAVEPQELADGEAHDDGQSLPISNTNNEPSHDMGSTMPDQSTEILNPTHVETPKANNLGAEEGNSPQDIEDHNQGSEAVESSTRDDAEMEAASSMEIDEASVMEDVVEPPIDQNQVADHHGEQTSDGVEQEQTIDQDMEGRQESTPNALALEAQPEGAPEPQLSEKRLRSSAAPETDGLLQTEQIYTEPQDSLMQDAQSPENHEIVQTEQAATEPRDSLMEDARSPGKHEVVQSEQAVTEVHDDQMQDAQSPELAQQQLRDDTNQVSEVTRNDAQEVTSHATADQTQSNDTQEVTPQAANDQAPDSTGLAETCNKAAASHRTAKEQEAPQLLTPGDTQPKPNPPPVLKVNVETSPEENDRLAAEAQIMSELQEYQSPIKGSAARGQELDLETMDPQSGSIMVHDQTSKSGGEETEVFLSLYSLRSRTHRRTESRETNDSLEDPTVRLARASTPAHPRQAPDQEESAPAKMRIAGEWGSPSDPSVRLAQAPDLEPTDPEGDASSKVAPKKADAARSTPMAATPSPTSKRPVASTEVTRELRSKTQDASRGSTPDTVTESMLKSPSVASSMQEDEDIAALKRNLAKQLRTALPDYLPLRSLRSSLNKTIDMMAVATMAPPQPYRPKGGPRDYMMEVLLTDPSTSSVVVAQLFRPHLTSLPTINAGDVVLLRRMQVVSVKDRGFGARAGDGSSWAVFEKADEEMLPQITGPPVEVTDAEVEHAQGLRRWWAMQGARALERIEKATVKTAQAGKGDAR